MLHADGLGCNQKVGPKLARHHHRPCAHQRLRPTPTQPTGSPMPALSIWTQQNDTTLPAACRQLRTRYVAKRSWCEDWDTTIAYPVCPCIDSLSVTSFEALDAVSL